MIVPSIGQRSHRLAAVLGLFIALELVAAGRAQAQVCSCALPSPFGSCRDASSIAIEFYRGQFPGPAAVVARPGEPVFLFFADLFSGQTFVFDGGNLLIGEPLVLASPRGGAPTTGLAYHPGEDRLYWTIGNRIVVTEAPRLAITPEGLIQKVDELGNPLPAVFDNVITGTGTQARPLELAIDVATLANEIGADAPGNLAGLTYHAGRDTLWTVDIVNDTYFEVQLNGSLSRENGEIVRFPSPVLSESNRKAFGNSITYAATDSGEFFDILVGTLLEGRPTRVVRVAAPTQLAEGTMGEPTGASYPLFPGLTGETVPGTLIPTAITYWPESCGPTNASELLMIYDSVGSEHRIYNVSTDPPTVTTIADFACAPEGDSSIRLTWRPTGGYDSLEIFRSSVTNPGNEALVFSTATSEDQGSFLDAQLPVPVDGAYTYRAIAKKGAESAPPVFCTTTIGRGALVTSVSLATATGKKASEITAYALTATTEQLLLVDALKNVAYALDPETLASEGEIQGPFAAVGGQTTGIAWAPEVERLFWLGRLGELPVLIATRMDGSSPGPQRPVQFPLDFVRTPELGDLAWDPVRGQLWVTAVSHGKVFAITTEGRLVAESVIGNPVAGGVLGGGISVVAADEASVTLDLIAGAGPADRLVRNRYALDDLSLPVTEQIVLLQGSTGSIVLGGVGRGTRGGVAVIQVLGTDTDRLYLFRDQEAPIGSPPFRRGDANNDGSLNISDPSFVLAFLFRSGSGPSCAQAADANDDGEINLSDALSLFNWLFRDGEVPPAPGIDCGFDPTPSGEGLGCESSVCVGG